MKEEKQKVSRRLFLTVGSTAAVAPFLLSGSSAYASGSIPKVSNTNLILFVQDPATVLAVVGAGLDVAIKLKELFGKDAKGGNTKLLAEIHQQNVQIINMLGEVLIVLRNLGVTIRAGVRDELINDAKVDLKVAFDKVYQAWGVELADRNNPRIRSQASEIYKAYFYTIANIGNKLTKVEEYGCAHFQTVGHAMLVEMWISHRLRQAREFRRSTAQTYERYFETVLNPNEVGSVGAQLAAANAQVARMDKILVEADKYISENPTSIVERGKIAWHRNGASTTYDVQATVSGNRNSAAYTYVTKRVNQRYERVRPDNGGGTGGGGRGGGGQKRFDDRKPLVEPDPPVPRDRSLIERIKYWNSVRKVYLAAKGEAQALEKSRETANIYKNIAQEIISNP